VQIGDELYAKGDGLTEDPKEPWVKLDPDDETADSVIVARLVKLIAIQSAVHDLIGGVAFATSFEDAGGTPVDGVGTKLYTVGVDVPKAAAAKAFGEYIDQEVASRLPKTLALKFWVGDDQVDTSLG
jgi:hypothetical protein